MMYFAAVHRLFATTPAASGARQPSKAFLAAALSAVVVALATTEIAVAAEQAKPKIDLAPTPAAAQQVRVVIDVTGELKVNPDGKEVRRLPITVQAEQQYVERTLPAKAGGKPSLVRFYRTAEAKLKLKDTELPQTLREDRRHIVIQPSDERPVTFSPLGPLKRDELELLEVPGATLPLTALLPSKPVSKDETWKLSDTTLARLMCLDVVHQQDVVCKLESVDKDVAILSISGKAAGAVEGVSSDVEVIAKCNFDLKQKCVTWLAIAIKENRAIGHAQPGFETVTKLRMVTSPNSSAVELTDKSLAGLPLHGAAGELLLELQSDDAGYQMMHDRRWRVMVDRHDATILRMVDRGDLIAQCNISRLPKLENGAQLTMEGLQKDIEKTLGKNFGNIEEASAQVNGHDVRVMKVVVAGVASELPIQWTYYHLSDDDGNRASIVFTIESKLVERFAAIDGEFVSAFRFLPQSGTSEKQSSPAVESAAKPSGTPRK